MFTDGHADVFAGDENWRGLDVLPGDRFTSSSNPNTGGDSANWFPWVSSTPPAPRLS